MTSQALLEPDTLTSANQTTHAREVAKLEVLPETRSSSTARVEKILSPEKIRIEKPVRAPFLERWLIPFQIIQFFGILLLIGGLINLSDMEKQDQAQIEKLSSSAHLTQQTEQGIFTLSTELKLMQQSMRSLNQSVHQVIEDSKRNQKRVDLSLSQFQKELSDREQYLKSKMSDVDDRIQRLRWMLASLGKDFETLKITQQKSQIDRRLF